MVSSNITTSGIVGNHIFYLQENKYFKQKGTNAEWASLVESGKRKADSKPNSLSDWKPKKAYTLKQLTKLIHSGKAIRFGSIDLVNNAARERYAIENNLGTIKNYELCDLRVGSVSGFYVDIDGCDEETFDKSSDHPFIREYCALKNFSSSQIPGLDSYRFHMVFLYAEPQDWKTSIKFVKFVFNHLQTELFSHSIGSKKATGSLDSGCFEPTRIKFGSTPESVFEENPKALLIPNQLIEELTAGVEDEEISKVEISQGLDLKEDSSKWLFSLKALRQIFSDAGLFLGDINTYSVPKTSFDHDWQNRGLQTVDGVQYDGYDFRTYDPGDSKSLVLTICDDGRVLYCPRGRQYNGNYLDYLVDYYIFTHYEPEEAKKLLHDYDTRTNSFRDAIDYFLEIKGLQPLKYLENVKDVYHDVTRESQPLIKDVEPVTTSEKSIFYVLEDKLKEIDYMLDTSKKGKGTPEAHFVANFLENGQGNIRSISGRHYVHNGQQYWQYVDIDELTKFIQYHLSKMFSVRETKKDTVISYVYATQRNTDAIKAYCTSNLAVTTKELSRQDNLINFKNGVYDCKNHKMIEYSKDYFFIYQHPVDLTIGVTEPSEGFLYVISKTYGIEKLQTVRAVLRYYLDTTLKYRKFVHILGESGSGKGILINFLRRIYGDKFGDIQFDQFLTPDKRYQSLLSKILVAIPDAAVNEVMQSKGINSFYDFVEGMPLQGRKLHYSDQITIKTDQMRFIMASTKNVQLSKEDGWQRRVFVLQTKPRQSLDPDLDLENHIYEDMDKTISWIFSMEEKEVKRILCTSTRETVLLSAEHSLENDSIAEFIDKCLVLEDWDKDFKPTKASLYMAYKAFCEFSKRPVKKEISFCRELQGYLKKYGLVVESHTKKLEGKVQRIPMQLQGIGFVNGLFRHSAVDGFFAIVPEFMIEGTFSEIELTKLEVKEN